MLKKRYHKFTEQLMFAIVMRDAALCRELIERIIPDRKVREIRFAENPLMDALAKSISDDAVSKPEPNRASGWMTAETEKVLIPALLSKSVRFDALFEDEDAWFDIEMQVDWEPELPLRIRYYHASKTITSLESGDDYRNLKPGYVIFICLFDYVGLGEAVYRYQTMEENLHLPLNDKQFTIIANLKCPEEKIPEKLRSFYQYVNHGEAGEDTFTQRIKEMVDRANESAEVQNMITFAGDIAAREKQLEAMMKQLSQELAEKEAKAKEMSEALAEKEAKAKEMSEALAEKEAKAKEMSEALDQKDAANRQMSEALAEKEAKAKEMSEALAEKEAKAKEMSEALAEKEAQTRQLQQKLENEKLEIAGKMKAQGLPDEVIAAVTGLNPDMVETLQSKMTRRIEIK